MEAKELKERVARSQNSLIEAQIKLTQTKAIGPDNGGEGEMDRARLIKGWLGFADALEEYFAPDSRAKEGVRPNLLARVFGKDRSRALWVVSHLDTVPEGDLGLWRSDPFQAYVKDGSVFGRGVEDNQQAIVCSLFASKLILDAGLLPEMERQFALFGRRGDGQRLRNRIPFQRARGTLWPRRPLCRIRLGIQRGRCHRGCRKVAALGASARRRKANARLHAASWEQRSPCRGEFARQPRSCAACALSFGRPDFQPVYLDVRAYQKRGKRGQREHHPRKGRVLLRLSRPPVRVLGRYSWRVRGGKRRVEQAYGVHRRGNSPEGRRAKAHEFGGSRDSWPFARPRDDARGTPKACGDRRRDDCRAPSQGGATSGRLEQARRNGPPAERVVFGREHARHDGSSCIHDATKTLTRPQDIWLRPSGKAPRKSRSHGWPGCPKRPRLRPSERERRGSRQKDARDHVDANDVPGLHLCDKLWRFPKEGIERAYKAGMEPKTLLAKRAFCVR